MNKIKEQALNKLLEEVNRSNNDAIDKIHNWISDQNDTELFTGILQKGKNLAEALSYCASKVKRSGNYGIATDEAVFSWVKEYFMLSSTNVSKENVIVKTNTKQKVDNDEKRKRRNAMKRRNDTSDEVQLSIFDL
ncbi:Cas9 inhibitor AcrIIA9 family protein [Erysipelothrix rhusiopathiae]|nr:Cas9 inhibitor AcrIIA9 family protein [Erysipelothrix rhusiopathiae]MDE8156635.1 Cas9 inhibitor AcrIIA9 family protein [Erysipelothrix rhusiopathiae]MDE8277620.1 Cas9 inhibitor AcrIIA9 family protein [Erysipelothrix rhusiopathiae]MDE9420600.1 Cas9 inhibitor AcrIIA9 family protein [Erysipelothrix rhusiopathiae]